MKSEPKTKHPLYAMYKFLSNYRQSNNSNLEDQGDP